MKGRFTRFFPADLTLLKVAVFACMLTLTSIFNVSAQGQTKVSGTVKDRSGAGLPGVTVRVKDQTGGVSTDNDGKFTISVAPNAILQFNMIGYNTVERKVGGGAINIVLEDASNALDEVVVIGFGGKVKRSDLSSAVSSVSAKDIQERQPVDLLNALQGKASGVTVTTDGGPGGEGTVQIRGVTTLNGGAGPDRKSVV